MSSPREIHLINPLWSSAGGSELRTIELYRELVPHAVVKIWTEDEPAADLAAAYPIRRIDLANGMLPRAGTLVFVGAYRVPGEWVADASPQRTVVIYNIFAPRRLLVFMRRLFDQGIAIVEIVFGSEMLRQRTKLKGVAHNSLIDIERFVPRPTDAPREAERFVVGRLSRNVPGKHHADDLEFYHRAVAQGCQVRIMGGHCLVSRGPLPYFTELFPVNHVRAESFLQGLDCFFYRTADEMWEVFGRVVIEAMACGLPVVCHRNGGYVTQIDHGLNGFIFDTNDEALTIVRRLQNEPELRRSIGAAARQKAEAMYSPEERAKLLEFYLR